MIIGAASSIALPGRTVDGDLIHTEGVGQISPLPQLPYLPTPLI